jgi:CRISPR-associated protein Csm2
MAWPRTAKPDNHKTQQAMRELLLLKPRLAYQAKREPPVEGLERVLAPMIDTIDGDRDRFQRFVDFFEAVLAYHTSYGGGV